MSIKIELSTACFTDKDYFKKIEECRKFIEGKGYRFGIQLHNSVTRKMYDELKSLRVEFSIHAPVLSPYLLNLANDDFEDINSGFQDTLKAMEELKAKITMFHGFFMTKKKIKNDPKNYTRLMSEAIDQEYRLGDTNVMDPKYFDTDEFKQCQYNVKRNMNLLCDKYPQFIICIENDFPGVGNGNQTPEQLIFLECPIWLDIGHLWAASILHKFDFYEGINKVCRNTKVAGVHLNTNQIGHDWDFKRGGDTHSRFSRVFEMDMDRIIHILKKNRVENYTMEMIGGDINDVKFFIDAYEQHKFTTFCHSERSEESHI